MLRGGLGDGHRHIRHKAALGFEGAHCMYPLGMLGQPLWGWSGVAWLPTFLKADDFLAALHMAPVLVAGGCDAGASSLWSYLRAWSTSNAPKPMTPNIF